MKAYEFYVLLGKYKRMSLTQSEFERFCTAVENVRRFRHAFYESTGEYYPLARRRFSRKSKKTSHSNAGVLEAPRSNKGRPTSNAAINRVNDFVEQEWREGRKQRSEPNTEEKSAKKSDEKVTKILDQHQEFRRVRNHHRRKNFRWYRLGRDIARHHPFKLFLGLGLLTAILIVAIFRPGFSNSPFHTSPDTSLEELKEKSTELELATESLTSGRFMSEADKLLAIDPRSFEINVETEINAYDAGNSTPAVGLEQAIRDGLESRFPKPEEVLPKLDFPDVELEEPTDQL